MFDLFFSQETLVYHYQICESLGQRNPDHNGMLESSSFITYEENSGKKSLFFINVLIVSIRMRYFQALSDPFEVTLKF